MKRRKIISVIRRNNHKRAIFLIGEVVTVVEVVADELGVNTVAVLTAEAARLVHREVKVEGSELLP